MLYFSECRTAEELKSEYKKLVFKFHPDVNKNENATAIMQEINNEYEAAWERLKSVHINANGEIYTKDTNEVASEYQNIINAVIRFYGVTVEIIGSWVWLTGETKKYKDHIKELGFKFAPNKAAWYYHAGTYRKRGRKKYGMNEIRNMWGSTMVNNEHNLELETA